MKECPNCKKWNPNKSEVCDCGYVFVEETSVGEASIEKTSDEKQIEEYIDTLKDQRGYLGTNFKNSIKYGRIIVSIGYLIWVLFSLTSLILLVGLSESKGFSVGIVIFLYIVLIGFLIGLGLIIQGYILLNISEIGYNTSIMVKTINKMQSE